MSNRQTYRVTVLTSQLHVIDIPARDENDAIARAKTLWHAGQTQQFDCIHHNRQEQFGIDNEASEDRAQKTANAVKTFDHAFTIAFNLRSAAPDGSDSTPQELRHAIIARLAALDDGELIEAVGAPYDTYEV